MLYLPTLSSNTYRLAFAETHAYVTLESYVVGTWEFERVETGQQRLGIRVVVPLAEYCRVGRASILVGYYILVLDIVFDGFGNTASGVPSVDAYNTRIGHYTFSLATEMIMWQSSATKVQILILEVLNIFKY